MNPFDLPDSYSLNLMGVMLGLLWTSFIAAVVLLAVELLWFLGLTAWSVKNVRLNPRQPHHPTGPAAQQPAVHPPRPH